MEDYRDVERRIKEILRSFRRASFVEVVIFDELNKGNNIMTPERMGLLSLESGRWITEVTYGTGMSQNYIFGVTVVQKDTESGQWVKSRDLSKLCNSTGELRSYLEELDNPEEDEE